MAQPFGAVCVVGGEYQREVRQRREVAGGTHGALRRDFGRDPAVEHFQQGFHQHGAHAGVANGQGVGADEHRGAHDFLRQRRAGAHRVAEHQVAAQLCGLCRGNAAVGEDAKAGVDAIHRLACGQNFLYPCVSAQQALTRAEG